MAVQSNDPWDNLTECDMARFTEENSDTEERAS